MNLALMSTAVVNQRRCRSPCGRLRLGGQQSDDGGWCRQLQAAAPVLHGELVHYAQVQHAGR